MTPIAGKVYSKDEAERFVLAGHEMRKFRDTDGYVLAGWNDSLLTSAGRPVANEHPRQEVTVDQMIELLVVIRDEGHGGLKLRYSGRDDFESVEGIELSYDKEYVKIQ